MVLISSKKYACETCIKGHRSSACKHTDRPLFEIKKKGRPVTQCEHCRELRKTKQVHVKCICEAKEAEPTSPASDSPSTTTPAPAPKKKKGAPGTPTLPAHAAFPHGVPAALVAAAEGPSSDSDHGGSASAGASGCSCTARGGACHCCTPRTRPPRRRSNSSGNSTNPTTNPNNTSNPPNTNATSSSSSSPTLPPRAPSHHILARIAELRPVLPRPSARDVLLGQHDLFHGHALAHHHPEHFSPYGRAHDFAVGTSPFYTHDAGARSTESVASQRSAASHSAAPKKSQSQKSPSQKSHSTSPSYDGSGTAAGFFGQQPMEWRLPPSLARSEGSGAAYPRARPGSTDDDAPPPRSADGERPPPRSADGYEYDYDYDAAYVPQPPRSADDEYPRARSDDGLAALSAGGGGVRTCGCGDGCACPGCALHGSSSPSHSHAQQNGKKQASCAAAACGGACLDCTILSLPDFGAVVGFGGGGGAGGFQAQAGEGYANDASGNGADENGGTANGDGNETGEGGEYARLYRDTDVELELELERELEGYADGGGGGGGGFGTLDERAIDEWIREVGALPPLPPASSESPVPPPFEFGMQFGEGYVPGPGEGQQQQFGGGGDSQFADEQQQQFADDAQFQPAWMFDVAPGTPAPAPMRGLASAASAAPGGDGVRFLSVPGALRSRSSSSASSEVSGLSAAGGAGGVAGGGAGGSGIGGVGLAGLSLDARPGSGSGNTGGSGEGRTAARMGVGPGVGVVLFPPPAYVDEPMFFY